MPNRKISELRLATSSLATDGLVIQRGGTNFRLEASNFSTGTADTGSLVTTSSISGTTITFTKGDGSTYTNEIVSASYAVTASHEVVKEVSSSYADTATSASHAVRADEADQAISASYAVSASLAQLALEAVSSSYAISASHAEVSDEAISSSYAITASHATSTAGTLSNGTSVDAFSFDGSTDVTVDISTYSASVSTDRTALSASASTAREFYIITGSISGLTQSFTKGNGSTFEINLPDTGSPALANSLTQGLGIDTFTFNGTADAQVQLDTSSAHFTVGVSASQAPIITALSASLTTTDQTISSSVAALSGSASDARNLIAGDLDAVSASFNERINTNDVDILGLNTYSASLKTAISVTGPDVTILGDLTVQGTQSIIHSTEVSIDDNILSLNGTGATNGGIEVNDPSGPLSGSLLWDGANNRWIAGQSGSESVVLVADGLGILSSSAQIAGDISGSSVLPISTLSGSASDARNVLATDYIAADTTLSSSLTTTDQAISSSVASLSGSASDARNALSGDFVLKAGDTMTGPLSMSGNNILLGNGGGLTSDAGAFIGTGGGGETIQLNGSNADSFNFVVRNPTNLLDSLLSVTSSNGGGNTILGRDLLAGSNQLKDVADPTAAQDAATKNYVDTSTANTNYVAVTGDTMTGKLTVDVSGDGILDDELPLSIKGAGIVIGDRNGDRRTFTNGTVLQFRDYGITHWNIKSSGSFEISQNSGGANDGYYMKFPIITKNVEFNNGILQNIANPTGSQDAATKNYVDVLSGSASTARNTLAAGLAPPISVVGAAWDSSTAAQTMNQGKWSFNLNSSRQVEESDATQATFNTTNNEWVLKEGTWEISADLTKTSTTGAGTRFFHIRFNTTAGSFYNAGTAIDDSDVAFATTGNQKVIMRAILTVPASATRYVWANFGSGNAFSAKHQKMTVKKIA